MKKMYISKGNKKMTGVMIWSLPSKVTCPNRTSMCEFYCYARQAELMYPQSLPARQGNFNDTRKETFVNDMIEAITKMVKSSRKVKLEYFRIHESGDFYNEEYFEKWLQIIKAFPQVKFLAFTKSTFVSNYIDKLPENFHLYYSVMADTKKDNIVWDLPLAFAGDYRHVLDKDVFECKGNCDSCLHCFNKRMDVHFKIH
jgi:hypothetical protein